MNCKHQAYRPTSHQYCEKYCRLIGSWRRSNSWILRLVAGFLQWGWPVSCGSWPLPRLCSLTNAVFDFHRLGIDQWRAGYPVGWAEYCKGALERKFGWTGAAAVLQFLDPSLSIFKVVWTKWPVSANAVRVDTTNILYSKGIIVRSGLKGLMKTVALNSNPPWVCVVSWVNFLPSVCRHLKVGGGTWPMVLTNYRNFCKGFGV